MRSVPLIIAAVCISLILGCGKNDEPQPNLGGDKLLKPNPDPKIDPGATVNESGVAPMPREVQPRPKPVETVTPTPKPVEPVPPTPITLPVPTAPALEVAPPPRLKN